MTIKEMEERLDKLNNELNNKYRSLGGEKYKLKLYPYHQFMDNSKIHIMLSINRNVDGKLENYHTRIYDRLDAHMYNILNIGTVVCDDDSFKKFEKRFKQEFNILEEILKSILKDYYTQADLIYSIESNTNMRDFNRKVLVDYIKRNDLIKLIKVDEYRDRLLKVAYTIVDDIDLSEIFIYLISKGEIQLSEKSSNKLTTIYVENLLPEIIKILKEEIK